MISRGQFLLFFLVCFTFLFSQNNCQASYDDYDYSIIDSLFNVHPSTTLPLKLEKSKTTTTTTESYDETDYTTCTGGEKCVSQFLCENETINYDGKFLIEEQRDAPTTSATEYCGPFRVCCKVANINESEYIDQAMCEEPKYASGCSLSTKNARKWIESRNGSAHYADFPWMVALLSNESEPGIELIVYRGGGALILPGIVVTASHIVEKLEHQRLIIRAGELDFSTEDEICPHVERKVKKVISHSKFNRETLKNDLALLVLENDFPITQVINTICLPPKNTNFEGQPCFMSGWGKDKFGQAGQYSDVLKKVELPVMKPIICQYELRKTRLGRDFRLHKSFLCAGGAGKSPCTGDGGSPLVCQSPVNSSDFYLAGIVSGSIGCNEIGVPSLFASLTYHHDWIDEEYEKIVQEVTNFRET